MNAWTKCPHSAIVTKSDPLPIARTLQSANFNHRGGASTRRLTTNAYRLWLAELPSSTDDWAMLRRLTGQEQGDGQPAYSHAIAQHQLIRGIYQVGRNFSLPYMACLILFDCKKRRLVVTHHASDILRTIADGRVSVHLRQYELARGGHPGLSTFHIFVKSSMMEIEICNSEQYYLHQLCDFMEDFLRTSRLLHGATHRISEEHTSDAR